MNNFDVTKIKADWSRYERRPSWSVINSRELAKVFGVSLQSINNWKMREILPEPEPHTHRCPCPRRSCRPPLKGNKNYYRISKIRAWHEARPELDVHWEWVNRWIGPQWSCTEAISLAGAEFFVVGAYEVFGVERPLIPSNFHELEQESSVLEPEINTLRPGSAHLTA